MASRFCVVMICAILFVASLAGRADLSAADTRPNIVLIIADDKY